MNSFLLLRSIVKEKKFPKFDEFFPNRIIFVLLVQHHENEKRQFAARYPSRPDIG